MHWIRPICWLCLFVPAAVGTQGLYALMAQPLPVVTDENPSRRTVPRQQSAPATPPSADSEAESIDELRASARRSKETVAELTAALERDGTARRHAVMALGGKGESARTAVPLLQKLLRRPDARLRTETAITLGSIGPEARSAIPLLSDLLRDADADVRNAAADALRSVRWELHAPCKPEAIPPSAIKDGKAVLLNIPARDEVPELPEEGWCGEVAIQEALLYHGAYFPQRVINAAGEPEHPDLYADELPEALRSLRVTFDSWSGGQRQELAEFMRWVRRRIAAGTPVLVGLKIYPTAHPDWILDHFSLAVGAADKTLSVNTAWGYREECSDEQLTSTEEGFSFKNDQNRYYAIAIERPKATADSAPVRLFTLSEAADVIHVLVKCEGLAPGQQYVLERFAPNDEKNAVAITTFVAQGAALAIYDKIDKAKPIFYRCRASSRQNVPPKTP